MIFRQEPMLSTVSLNYDSEASDERPSQPTHTKIQANFQIARPPPKSSLWLRPRLLLQIQQVISDHRPVPVLEIWQPLFRKPKLSHDFLQRPKLHRGDIYATSDESYRVRPGSPRKALAMSDSEASTSSTASQEDQQKDIVAVMCQLPGETAPAATLHFSNAQRSWQGRAGTAGADNIPCYRFTIHDKSGSDDDPGRMVLQWEKRNTAKEDLRSRSAHAEQFALFLIDRQKKRKSRIATMDPGGLEILIRKTDIIENLQVCLDLTSPVSSSAAGSGLDAHENLLTWLYTHVLTLGVWVAQQEGWFS
ncbi:hypothetical protein N7462_008849 [Penicillium macrosclerotiorum]|uniref:uncharacterized protein n=1 Tax=Penicillium macrosclerotiorum TaxID=303699 RepID=UPI002548FC7A|nr:uncharacterized protein N7462_008849 [Penicillium macrosclerotiorum]KAJ5675952.1 hypothetical protein N7462_008849 [Penicillium macrosclerotiorum]